MEFLPTTQVKIQLSLEDWQQLSRQEKIEGILAENNSDDLAFDIFQGDTLIGFALLRCFAPKSYFLQDFAIDTAYQNRGYGQQALMEMIAFLRAEFALKVLTTTYRYGNTHAQYVYEKVGFCQTSVVNEDGIHEVNLRLDI